MSTNDRISRAYVDPYEVTKHYRGEHEADELEDVLNALERNGWNTDTPIALSDDLPNSLWLVAATRAECACTTCRRDR